MKLFAQLLANGLVNGALYAMLAVGFGIVWRSLRVFHVAYGGLYVLCSYLFYMFVGYAGIPLGLAFALTLVCAAGAGWVMEICLYRPFYQRQAGSGAVLIASMGIFLVLENLIAMIFGNELQTISRGISRTWLMGPVVLTALQVLQFVTGIIVVGLLWVLVQRLRTFKALWAMGDQPDLIPVLGLPMFRLRNLALIVSTVMVAIPASLICMDVGTDPHIGMSYLLIAAVAVLVGGINSYSGWVCGAVILALLQSLVVWQFSARWMDLVTFALLVAMLVLRPRGLMEKKLRMEETR